MKVHRLAILTRLSDRHHLAGSEDTTTIGDALNGLPDYEEAREQLEAGRQVKRNVVVAGIENRIVLTPASAVNRTGLANAKRIGRLV